MVKRGWLTGLVVVMIAFSGGYGQTPGNQCACCTEEHKQFDFWLGDWVVYSNGQMVGFNKIVLVENDCALRENWKSVVSSHTGTSYNFYDNNLKKWRHVWIGSDGVSVDVTGEYKDRKMTMVSNEYRDEKGNRMINKVTWHNNPDGTVRHTWEQSKDGGLAYTMLWDALYRKRK